MKKSPASIPARHPHAPSINIDELPLPFLEIDTQGIIIRANRAALALHHPDNGDLVGMLVWDMVAVDEKDFSSAASLAHMESGEEPPVVTRSIFDRSGSFRTYQLHRSLIRDAAGNPTGMRIVGVNVSEMTQALEEARRHSLRLMSVMDSLHEAVIVTDATGVITGMNPAAEELLGWKAAEMAGKIIEEAIHVRSIEDSGNSGITFVMWLASQCNGLSKLVNRHGREIVVRVWSSPVIDKTTGSVAGVVLMLYEPGVAHPAPGR